jgi:hypothetical protein
MGLQSKTVIEANKVIGCFEAVEDLLLTRLIAVMNLFVTVIAK